MKTASPENTGGLFFGTKEERKQIALQLSQYFDRIFFCNISYGACQSKVSTFYLVAQDERGSCGHYNK